MTRGQTQALQLLAGNLLSISFVSAVYQNNSVVIDLLAIELINLAGGLGQSFSRQVSIIIFTSRGLKLVLAILYGILVQLTCMRISAVNVNGLYSAVSEHYVIFLASNATPFATNS